MDVLCIGNLNYDISFHLSRLPEIHEKIRCENTTFSCGGSAGNTACWLGTLGLSCGILGGVGDDAFGRAQIQDLHAHHVDTSHLIIKDRSGIAVIMVEGEVKRMIKYSGANRLIDAHNLPMSDHIHMSSIEKSILETVISTRSDETILSWDPQELFFKEYIPSVDYIFINEDDLRRYTGNSSLEDAVASLDAHTVIVTMNGGGCTIFRDLPVDLPSFGVKALDTTGAGDAFDAGFIFGLLSDLDVRSCGILGTACASLKVQHVGARGGICSWDDLKKFLHNHNIRLSF
ncbi:MAG: carbohydrate kinase family protein [Theionarchaea archaeon]|nr:carbohydrate kinase family protein [Theionarchaea archaeon]